MSYLGKKALKTYIINPNGSFKEVVGHLQVIVEYMKQLNPNLSMLKESDISDEIRHKFYNKGFIRINKFENAFSMEFYKKPIINQIKSLIQNIPEVDIYIVEYHYNDTTKIFNDKKSLIDFLFTLL